MTYQTRTAKVFRPENEVGKIVKPYGGKDGGGVLVNTYDIFPEEDRLKTEPLWVGIDSLAVPLFIREYREQGGKRAIILFDDFERLEAAAMLVGLKLFSEQPVALQQKGQIGIRMHEFVGFELLDRISGKRGKVAQYYDYPGNPVVVVKFAGANSEQEVMVPMGLATTVDRKRRRIEVEMPQGLFEV